MLCIFLRVRDFCVPLFFREKYYKLIILKYNESVEGT